MIIGLILCALTAVLLFFKTDIGGARKIVYMLIVAALIGCPFIPVLTVGEAEISLGILLMPILAGFVLMFLIKLKSELLSTLLSVVVTISLTVAVIFLMYSWDNEYKALTVSICVGVLAGSGAYLVTKRAVPSVSAALIGVPLGELTAALIAYYFLDSALIIGSKFLYDGVILSGAVALVLSYGVAALSAWRSARRMEKAENFEAGIDYGEFEGEYKKYFDDMSKP